MHPSNLLGAMMATGGFTDDAAKLFTGQLSREASEGVVGSGVTSPHSPGPKDWKNKNMDDMDRKNLWNPMDWFGMHEEEQYGWRAEELAKEGMKWHPHYPGNESNPSGIGAEGTNELQPEQSPIQPRDNFINYDAYKPHGGLKDWEIKDKQMQENMSGPGKFLHNWIAKPIESLFR